MNNTPQPEQVLATVRLLADASRKCEKSVGIEKYDDLVRFCEDARDQLFSIVGVCRKRRSDVLQQHNPSWTSLPLNSQARCIQQEISDEIAALDYFLEFIEESDIQEWAGR